MLYFLIFIEGFIGLAYQMLFIRQLTPEVGASAVTSSWIIGFFLLALAIGYKHGGIATDNPKRVFGANMLKAALIGGLGASSVGIMLFFSGLKSLTGLSTIPLLIAYCVAFVVPVAYWMGQSLPLLIQCSKWGDKTSEISGNALFLSTIGSFAGAIFTTNVLLYYIGATWSLSIVSLVAIGTAFWLLQAPVLALGAGLLVGWANIGVGVQQGLHSTQYADVYIRDKDQKLFIANNSVMSAIKEGQSTSWYIKEFERFTSGSNDKDILVLGAGGFVAHLNDTRNRYTYVDIDHKLKEISEAEFIGREITQEFVAEDARRYLIDNQVKRDVIFLDAFSSRQAIPSHLVTTEFFELIKSRIKPNGHLVVNTILDPDFGNAYSQRFHLTLNRHFPFCKVTSNKKDDETSWANVVYICNNIIDRKVYSDENNHNEIDFWSAN